MGVWLRLAIWLLLGHAASAQAVSITDFEHTAWTGKDGVGGVVVWVSQVPNGMLLLRTSTGYQVFDGVEFHSFSADKPPPFDDFASALGQRSPTGAVYFVHPKTRLLMRSWEGRTEEVQDKDRAAALSTRFTFDSQGIGWLPALNHLFRLEGLKVEVVNQAFGIPDKAHVGNLEVDARGTVWVGTTEGEDGYLYFLPRGEKRFRRMAETIDCFPLALAPDGTPWCASESGLVVVTMQDGLPTGRRFVSKKSHGRMIFDSRGGAWISAAGSLHYIDDWHDLLVPGKVEALETRPFTVKDGLSSDAAWDIVEDAQGNIWMGTGAGLDRFRLTPFKPVKLPRRDFGSAVLADPDGGLWVGNWDRALMHLSGGQLRDALGPQNISALWGSRQGTVWVGGEEGVWKGDHQGKFSKVPGPVGMTMPYLQQLAEDDTGALWVQSGRQLMRFKDGQWSKPEGGGVPPAGVFYCLAVDQSNQLWFFGEQRGPFILKDGVFREIKSEAFSKAVQKVHVAYAHGARMWFGHGGGVGVFQNGVFSPLTLKGDAAKRITGIVETAEGDLWLHGLSKAFKVSADQVTLGLKGQPADVEVFDFHDGLRAATSPVEPRPTLVQDAKGLLWFSTNQGLFWIDPHARRADASAAPPVLFRAVHVDGNSKGNGTVISLSPNPGHVEIAYAAAALGVSDRVRYRYRMLGLDKDWQEVGARRTAYYTQLSPGSYRFEVAASNEQGQWAQTPSVMAIEVQPAWYQTMWCRALLGLLLLLVLWGGYELRVNAIARRERARMREISAERERIARDLHDTVLQSMQGVILVFQGLATKLPPEDETRSSIEGQLDRADELLGEARDRVRDLRTMGTDAVSLREAFELAGAQLDIAASIHVEEEGWPRTMQPLTRDRIYLIGREALLNAAMHAGASSIQVVLNFGQRYFTLRIRDDGVGIDGAILAAGGREGHFGLMGMRERAAQIGAKLRIEWLVQGGTEVRLQVPADHVYQVPVSRWSWRRWLRR